MDIGNILKRAESLNNDEEKLLLLGDFIGNHIDNLENIELIKLLTPLVDITKRIYERDDNPDTLSDYSVALTKLAEYYINDEQGWKATPLLAITEELLNTHPDTEGNALWKYSTYKQIGECWYANQRRTKSKEAFCKALYYAPLAGQKTDDCEYSLQRVEKPMLNYDPIEDTDAYLAVIDEVERRLYEFLKDEPRHMGFCFRYWAAKREFLAEYGIEWRSPGVMNPSVIFD